MRIFRLDRVLRKKIFLMCTLTLIVLPFQNCGNFKPSHVNLSSRAGLGSLPIDAHVAIMGPADQTATQGKVLLTGQCSSGLEVAISGDIAAPVDLVCTEGAFEAELNLSAGDGNKTVVVKQTGSGGISSMVSRTFVRDTVAPVLSTITPAAGQAVQAQAVLQGQCESGLDVEIQESTKTYKQPCPAGSFAVTLPLLSADGAVSVGLAQTDKAGNRRDINLSLNKDTVAPGVSIGAPANGATVNSSATVSGSCESGLKVDIAGSGVAAPVKVDCTGGAYSSAVVFTNGAGAKTIQVQQSDLAGNSASAMRSVTRQADQSPAINITGPAANSAFRTNLTLTGTCQNGLAISLSGNGLQSPASASCANGMFSIPLTFTTGDGSKNIIVSQTGANGLTGSSSRTFLRDTVAPGLTITAPAANSYLKTTLQLMGACESGLAIQVSGTGVASASTATCANAAYNLSLNLSAGDGAKSVQVTQTDAAGNSASVTRSFVRDTVAPAVAILSPAADTAGETGLTISGSCEGTFVVTASGAGVASMVSKACAANAFSMDIVFSSGDGIKAVQVSQTDAAGNTGTGTRSFRRVPAAPDGALLYAQNCAGCHGALASSMKIGRTVQQISTAIATIPNMSGLSSLTSAQRQAIADALNIGTQPSQQFTCTDPNASAPLVARRLNKVEYSNTIRQLLENQASADRTAMLTELNPLLATIPDDIDTKFSRTDYSLSQTHLNGYLFVAKKVGALVAASDARTKAFFGSCATTSGLSSSCLDQFFAGMGRKIFRRPLTADEISSLKSSYSSVASEKNAFLAARMLMSPRFLMHIEDNGTQIAPGLMEVSAFELASRLSYHFQQTMPDDQLFAAAADGSLKTEAGLNAQIDRLMSGGQAAQTKSTVAEFYEQWLGLGTLPRPENATGAQYTAFAAGATLTRASMVQEIEDMTAHYTFNVNGHFNDLLTSDISFAKNADLASIYGVARWSGDPNAPVRLPAGQRSGLLNRAAFLAASTPQTNVIARGVKIRREILCDVLPPPPPEIGNMLRLPEIDPTLSTRKRYEIKTADAVCMSCHSKINPLGFALEPFDALGRYRTVEKIFDENGQLLGQQPVDPVVAPAIKSDDTAVSSSPAQFSQMLADSGKAQACFVQQYFHFTYRRKPDLQKDGCALEDLRKDLGSNGSLKKMFLNVAKARAFRLKTFDP